MQHEDCTSCTACSPVLAVLRTKIVLQAHKQTHSAHMHAHTHTHAQTHTYSKRAFPVIPHVLSLLAVYFVPHLSPAASPAVRSTYHKCVCILGISTRAKCEKQTHEATIERNAYPSPLNYYNFPKSVCTSVNESICHGIPDMRELKDGDIVNVDVSAFFGGYHGDLNEASAGLGLWTPHVRFYWSRGIFGGVIALILAAKEMQRQCRLMSDSSPVATVVSRRLPSPRAYSRSSASAPSHRAITFKRASQVGRTSADCQAMFTLGNPHELLTPMRLPRGC